MIRMSYIPTDIVMGSLHALGIFEGPNEADTNCILAAEICREMGLGSYYSWQCLYLQHPGVYSRKHG